MWGPGHLESGLESKVVTFPLWLPIVGWRWYLVFESSPQRHNIQIQIASHELRATAHRTERRPLQEPRDEARTGVETM